jgi:hypothetical protein
VAVDTLDVYSKAISTLLLVLYGLIFQHYKRVIVMYKVKFYKGDYRERQLKANADGAVGYVEQHFNSADFPTASYSVVVVGSNASTTSCNWGRWYSAAVSKEFNTKTSGDNGIAVGGFEGRGDGNVKYTKMPAILLEPLFASNPKHAEIIRSESGQQRLAQVLVESIQRFFPEGGLIAFSVGHKYKTSNPNDRGASVTGGGDEADFAELVLQKAESLLTGIVALQTERTIRVMQGDKVISTHIIDDDANVIWDAVRGVLRIID